MKKLTYEDGLMLDALIDKINEIIDYIIDMDERLNRRIHNHWAWHRRGDALPKENIKRRISRKALNERLKNGQE